MLSATIRLLLLLLLHPTTDALLIGPNATGNRSLWDQEGFIDVGGDGTWHVWYDNDFCHDGRQGAGISNYGHLTSTDGVHWIDRGIGMNPSSVCPCGTDVLPSTEPCATNDTTAHPVAGIGSGSAWAVPGKKNKYVINYSTNKQNDPFGQEISFATSDSPNGPWIPATGVAAYHEDGVHFKSGRWDTIMQFTHEGVMHGWWTATPADGTVGFGYGTTTDGLHWTTLPPAKVHLPGLVTSGTQLEVGGVARLPNGKWYAHACAIAWGHVSGLGGCFNVVSDAPGGPYNRTAKNWALLAYDAKDGIPAYFSRPFLGPDGIALVNYIHTSAAGNRMSTLKHAVIDKSDGITVRWVWWTGNDILKGPERFLQPQRLPGRSFDAQAEVRTIVLEAAHGSILEGAVTWGSDSNTAFVFSAPNATSATSSPSENTRASTATAGGFARLSVGTKPASAWSTLDLGTVVGEGAPVDSWTNSSHQGITDTANEPTRGLPFRSGDAVSWRLLYRQGLYELYFRRSGDQDYYFAAAYGIFSTQNYCSIGTRSFGNCLLKSDLQYPLNVYGTGADLTKVTSCVGGKKVDQVHVQLHGAFAHSTNVRAWQTTLDAHDYNPTC